MSAELETILIEVFEKGFSSYAKIQARRTNENYFQIVTEPPLEHVGSLRYVI
jgi:hypothetical protein